MKDLRVRWNVLVIFLALATAPACQLLSANNSSNQRQSSGLTLSNGSLDFGNVVVGGNKTLTVTVINNTSSGVTLVSAAVSKAEFSLTSPSMPATIAAGQSLPLSISFTPSSTGSASAKITIETDSPTPEIVLPLSANGVPAGQLSANPLTITFGNVKVGDSATQTETFTNSGGSDLTISQATVSGAGFQITGLTLPLTLTPGQSTNFSVVFTPKTSGSASGTITATGSASLSSFAVHLLRTGFNRGKTHTNDTTETVTVDMSGMGTAPGLLAVAPTSLSFGNVQVGTSQSQAATLTNSGGTSVTISQATTTGAGFSLSGLSLPLTLAAGQSTNFNVTFAPQSTGSVTGNIAILSDASNPTLNLPLSGTGVAAGSLTANPSSLSFGNVQIGSNSTLSETVTNSGGSSVTISQATATGAGFSVSGLSLPLTLTAGQSKTFSVVFAPSSAGSVSGNLAIISNGSNPTLNIPLSGTGVTAGALGANPSSLSFGSVQIGNNSTLSETLTNTGGSSVTITQATTTGAGFSTSGLSLPLTLTAGQSKTFSVAFAPSSAGSVSGNLAIISNGSNPTLNVPLSGTGVAPGALTANPSSLSFGSVQIGSNSILSETLTNTGGSSVTITQATTTGAGFSTTGLSLPLTLTAGQSTTFSVTFAPQSAGSVSGNVAITSNASNPTLNIPLSGTGVTPGTLSANPTSLSFGSVQIGSNSTLSETLTNTGGSSVTITQATATGAGFSVSGLSLPLTLTAGQSKTFSVVFAPSSAGSVSGNLAVISNGSNPTLNIPLSGTGVTAGTLTANPTSLSFGNVQTGSSSTLSEILTNSGGSSVTITQATPTGAGFSVSGLSLPLTLTAGQSKTFSVVFAPSSAGGVSGNLAIISNGSNPTLNIPLSGTGVTPGALSANPTSLSFGNVQIGNSSTLSETLTNTGGSSVTITQATATGAGFSVSGLSLPVTLTAGQSKTFSVVFAPLSAGSVSGNLAVISNGSNPTLNIPLSGTGVTPGTLSANPSSLSFGSVQVGNSATLSETLTNTGGSSLTISQATASGTGFSISGLNPPITLTAGQSFTFSATFAPTSAGSASGSISVVSNGSNPNLTVPMSGTGTAAGQLGVSPASLSFGNVMVGGNASLSGTLNATSASVTVSSASISNSEFSLSGLSFPFTLTAGGSANFTVTFSPSATGLASGTISFASNASNSPAVQSVSGTGTTPPQHSVDLSWSASTSVVSGYNVYRGTTSGGPYTRVNSALDALTAYTDSTVQAGQTYYYVTTAVDSSNTESTYSNEVQAIIPTP